MNDERYESFEDAGIDLPYNASGEVDTTCPECSGTRRKSREKCLSVNVDEGVWHCAHCQWSGRLWLPERPTFAKKSAHKLTVRKPQPPTAELHPDAVAWFAQRGIPESVLRANDIRATSEEVIFQYVVDGKHLNNKYRGYPEKGKFRNDKDTDPSFFNIDGVGESESVVIVEGEMDVLAIQAAGVTIPVISVPNGTGSNLDRCFANAGDVFERVERVVLAGDGDEAGRKLTDELARRIGREKCYTVEWMGDAKDANEVLVRFEAEWVADCINRARPLPVKGIITVSDVRERVFSLRWESADEGVRPFDEFGKLYRVADGYVTTITGVPGSGKSTFLDTMLINIARHEERVGRKWHCVVCSPENWPPERHMGKMAAKLTGKRYRPAHGINGSAPPLMDDDELGGALDWIEERFEWVNPDPMSLQEILDLARISVKRNGSRGLVLDPWNRLGHSRGRKSETDYISERLAEVKQFAAQNSVHVWVVAHPTKMETKFDHKSGKWVNRRVRPYDISGSHAWSDMSDMILCVVRDQELSETRVYVDKVRFSEHGDLGEARFAFDRNGERFVEP